MHSSTFSHTQEGLEFDIEKNFLVVVGICNVMYIFERFSFVLRFVSAFYLEIPIKQIYQCTKLKENISNS